MKMRYDPKVDAIYIDLAKGVYKKSRKISDAVLVDEDKEGKILGIEILSAKKNISSFDPKKAKFSVQTT